MIIANTRCVRLSHRVWWHLSQSTSMLALISPRLRLSACLMNTSYGFSSETRMGPLHLVLNNYHRRASLAQTTRAATGWRGWHGGVGAVPCGQAVRGGRRGVGGGSFKRMGRGVDSRASGGLLRRAVPCVSRGPFLFFFSLRPNESISLYRKESKAD